VDLETQKIVKDMKLKLRRAQKPQAAMFKSVDNASASLMKIYKLCHDVAEASEGAESRDAVEQLLDACYCARRSRVHSTHLYPGPEKKPC
jgi:hypothetical protein